MFSAIKGISSMSGPTISRRQPASVRPRPAVEFGASGADCLAGTTSSVVPSVALLARLARLAVRQDRASTLSVLD